SRSRRSACSSSASPSRPRTRPWRSPRASNRSRRSQHLSDASEVFHRMSRPHVAELSVKDLALVSELRLELAPGLTVLTGETGAGKSMLVDALLAATG